jgi:hypothetical protein
MKYKSILILILGLTFCSCNQSNHTSTKASEKSEILQVTEDSKDKKEIQSLMRQVLVWSHSNQSIDLLPVLTDSKDSVYIGFDLDKHKQNLNKLKESRLFANEFIDNYNQIILTLDRKLRNKEYEEWLVGDLPTFIFANDVDPWCLCQDNLEWDSVGIDIIKLNSDKGELNWKWGNLKPDYDPSWREFSYKFRVVKEENSWKIAYMQGFDFNESTTKDGFLHSNEWLPETQKIKATFEQLHEEPDSKQIQKKYVEIFPDDAVIFKKVFDSPKFDQLYTVSHTFIYKLAELSESYPDEVGRKLVTLCVGLKEWDADAIGYIQHVTIGYANSHYDRFMEIIKGLKPQDLDILATFLADVENHSAYQEYSDFQKKLQANGEQTVYDVFKKAKEDRINRNDHAF